MSTMAWFDFSILMLLAKFGFMLRNKEDNIDVNENITNSILKHVESQMIAYNSVEKGNENNQSPQNLCPIPNGNDVDLQLKNTSLSTTGTCFIELELIRAENINSFDFNGLMNQNTSIIFYIK